MYNNLYKSYWVNYQNEDTRVIDNNALMEQKIKNNVIHAANTMPASEYLDEESEDGFSGGLAAETVDALLAPDGTSNVVKAVSPEELEALQNEIEAAKEELAMLKAQADAMIEDAQAEIEAMKVQAYEEASAQGYQEGCRIGQEEADAIKNEYHRQAKQMEEEYEQMVKTLEPEFMETITGIYEHIFKVDLSVYHDFATDLIVNTLLQMETARNYMIHVSKEDYPVVAKQKDVLRAQTGGSASIEIVEDMTLPKAQCYIETENGIFDCSLDTQLQQLGKKLRLLSYESGK